MKIQHFSLPADDPKNAATTIARIIDGEATPFPPGGRNAWMAWSSDGSMQIECTPRGTVMFPEKEDVYGLRAETPQPYSEVHIGIAVDKPEAEIVEIASEAGWPARPSVRTPGEDGFSVLEVWVEGKFLLELLDPVQTARLEACVTIEKWKHMVDQWVYEDA